MKEYREHPRPSASEPRMDRVVGEAEVRPRARRFELRRSERPLDWPRILLAGLLLLVPIGLVGYLGLKASRFVVHWLHQQPQYQVPFQEIQLQPAPPDWFRGGGEAFLKQVRERSQESSVLSVLELDEGRLIHDFQDYSPWVDKVVRIKYPPGSILIDLVYKQPVAVHESSAGVLYLDQNAHILPAEDIDLEKLAPPLRISGQQLTPSPENRPGGIWKSGLAGAEVSRAEHCMQAAARLACFLQEPSRLAERRANPALEVGLIWATDPRGLFVQTAEKVQILWGEPPGDEPAGSMEALEKWEVLKKWAATNSHRQLAARGYWVFSRNDLRPADRS